MLQATEAEQKEDREIICGEVFTDVTGELDELAQGKSCYVLHSQMESPQLPSETALLLAEKLGVNRRCRFFEVLAPYLNKVRASRALTAVVGAYGVVSTCKVCMQKWDTAESLLYVCRRLWGQPYVGPVYTLLLHQWLLLNKDAGGTEQRQKHVNVLVSGKLLPAALSLGLQQFSA